MNADSPPKMYITFWGTRGSISTPGYATEKYGGNTPCVSVRCADTDIIVDAGTGIRNLGIELEERARAQGRGLDLHLLLSHTHWDHIQGLPFFAPAYDKKNNLKIYGSPNKESFLAAILEGQMDMDYFPVELNAMAANLSITEFSDPRIRIGPVTVDWQEQVRHPGGSVRYKLTVGRHKAVYATDIELDAILHGDNSEPENERLATEYRDFITGADLLIADAQYTSGEYEQKTGWGHSSIPLVLETAYGQCVKQVAMFHHEPQHSDVTLDKLSADYGAQYAAMDPPMSVFWAREGMTLAL